MAGEDITKISTASMDYQGRERRCGKKWYNKSYFTMKIIPERCS
jgi:hypothetical protein